MRLDLFFHYWRIYQDPYLYNTISCMVSGRVQMNHELRYIPSWQYLEFEDGPEALMNEYTNNNHTLFAGHCSAKNIRSMNEVYLLFCIYYKLPTPRKEDNNPGIIIDQTVRKKSMRHQTKSSQLPTLRRPVRVKLPVPRKKHEACPYRGLETPVEIARLDRAYTVYNKKNKAHIPH